MPDLTALKEGLAGAAELLVGEEHTAPRVGSGRVHVLATPVMINLMEAAALAAIERLLPAGHQSLGTHLNVGHYAATPVGMRLRASAIVTKIEGRTVEFHVEAFDERSVSAMARIRGSWSMSSASTSGSNASFSHDQQEK